MKIPGDSFRLPKDKQLLMQRAQRLEWISIGFLVSIVVVIGLVMGSSETMKAMWVEDLLSLIPPIGFLVGTYFFDRKPDNQFPYGYRRAVLIAFLSGALALLGFGLYILVDSVATLVMAEAPTIGTVAIRGRTIWLGWFMIAALLYSVLPPLILGRIKLPLARELHQKALNTDATINKGDWLAGLAGVGGITGIAYGFWWADAAAAIVISIEIIRGGWADLRNSVAQLMNKRPSDIDGEKDDPVPSKIQEELERLDWIQQAWVRLREDGDVLTGEAFIVPLDENNLLDRLKQASDVTHSIDWRLHDVNMVAVRSIES